MRMLHFVNTFVYWMVIFTGIMFLSVPLSDFTSCFKNRIARCPINCAMK